jgi:ferredoxin
MARPLWFVQLLKKTFPNVQMIAKSTKIPIIGRIIDYMLFQGDDIIYLPKNQVAKQVIKVNQPIEQPDETVLPSQIVHHFIDKANFHWIMDFCICRDSMKCEDYPIDYGCLFMGEAAKTINPQLGRAVSKEEAHKYIRKCDDEGLVHLIGRNRLDAMWLGVNPGERLLTVCNCCPCCCLWRVIQDVNPDIAKKITKMVGVRVEVTDACVGCGTCTEGICFANAISLVNDQSMISDECRGCGRCIEVCPEGAIKLHIDDTDFYEKSVKRVSEVVDVT